MPMRPASSTCRVLMKPCPSSPSNWEAGRRQSWKTTSLVSVVQYGIGWSMATCALSQAYLTETDWARDSA